jgi:peptide/nickel transport system permease protein
MLRYFLKRLMFLIPVLLGVSVVIFSIVHLAPGDPARLCSAQAPPRRKLPT